MTFNKWDGLPRYLPYKKAESPTERLINGAGAGDVAAVRAALAAGASVDAATPNGRTALHIAANNGECATIEYLVDRGADVNVRRADGRTPLYHASEGGHLEAVRILVDAGALITVRDGFGGTPLQITQSPAVLAYLESCVAQGIGTGEEGGGEEEG
jgi:ankyrin repeat protein